MRKLIWIPMLLISCQPAFALDNSASGTEAQFLRCLLGEAESESVESMTATAEAMRNRVAAMGFGRALKGVYGCKAVKESGGVFKRGKRVIPSYVVKRAVEALEASKSSKLVGGADHWEAVETFGKPKWAFKMIKTAKVGAHTFFK